LGNALTKNKDLGLTRSFVLPGFLPFIQQTSLTLSYQNNNSNFDWLAPIIGCYIIKINEFIRNLAPLFLCASELINEIDV
jgi:hypothetical protein